MLAASLDERRIFVAHLEGQTVTVIDRERESVTALTRPGPQYGIDAAADSVLAIFPSGGAGHGRVGFTPTGRLVVIPHDEPSTLTLVDVASRTPVASIPLAACRRCLRCRRTDASRAVWHPDAKLVSIVDLERRAVARTIALPGTPDGVAYAAVEVPRAKPALGAPKIPVVSYGALGTTARYHHAHRTEPWRQP